MAKILVTGATGLIGSHLLRTFGTGDVVYAISRSGPVPGATHTVAIDLGKPWSTDDLPQDIEVLVHLAQSEHYRDFPRMVEDVFAVNTLSTVKLLDYARITGIKRFVLASSGGVYGTGAHRFSEDEPVLARGEIGFYISTRICSELLSDCYSSYMNVICLRFFFAYGPGQQAPMLIPRLVESVRSGRAVTLHGGNGLLLNPVHVDDAVQAVRQAMKLKGSQKFNVAGPKVLSLREMVEVIGRLVDKVPVFEVVPAPGSLDLIADISRMRDSLWEPKVEFKDGVATMLRHATGV